MENKIKIDNLWRCLSCGEKLEPEIKCKCPERGEDNVWKDWDKELEKKEIIMAKII